jgi:hypothetical protein
MIVEKQNGNLNSFFIFLKNLNIFQLLHFYLFGIQNPK